MRELVDELRERLATVRQGGSESARRKHTDRGKLLVLACGYLFSGAMAVAHLLSFPGLFAPGGLLGAGPQTTAWLYMFWHAGFPLCVIGYAWIKRASRPRLGRGATVEA